MLCHVLRSVYYLGLMDFIITIIVVLLLLLLLLLMIIIAVAIPCSRLVSSFLLFKYSIHDRF